MPSFFLGSVGNCRTDICINNRKKVFTIYALYKSYTPNIQTKNNYMQFIKEIKLICRYNSSVLLQTVSKLLLPVPAVCPPLQFQFWYPVQYTALGSMPSPYVSKVSLLLLSTNDEHPPYKNGDVIINYETQMTLVQINFNTSSCFICTQQWEEY